MNEIIKEIQLMDSLVGSGYIPKPTYLYLQGYGKDLKNDIEDLREATKSRQALIFDKLQCSTGRSLIEDYEVLLEKNKPLGQEFEGLVLVDLNGLEGEELTGFVEYLSSKTNRNKYIFMIQDGAGREEIKTLLERYFFIRQIEAKAYSPEEQYGVIYEVLKQFERSGIQVEISPDAETVLMERLSEKEWQQEEAVLFRLRNATSAAVYEHLVSTQSKEVIVDEDFVYSILKGIETKAKEKRKIGFAIGGFENE